MFPNAFIQDCQRDLALKRTRAKAAWSSFEGLRAEAAKAGPRALADKATMDKLSAASKAYDEAYEDLGSAEKTMARMGELMADEGHVSAAVAVGSATVAREVSAWARSLGEALLGPSAARLPNSPSFTLIPKHNVKAALTSTADYPTVPFRRPGIVPLPAAPLTILDVLPLIPVENDVVEYVREKTFTNTAAETAEAGEAPEGTLEYEKKTVQCKWIPFTLPVTRQVLGDERRLQSFIDERLVRGVRERLQSQVMKGTAVGEGNAENLTGILNTAGILVQDAGADTKADLVHKAATKILVATKGRYTPNTLLIHPNDMESLELQKEGTDGAYVFGGPGSAGDGKIWRLTPVVNVDVDEGTPIVADITGAELYIREDVSVSVSDSHAENFIHGIVQMLAAGRFGFAVLEPKAFAACTDFGS